MVSKKAKYTLSILAISLFTFAYLASDHFTPKNGFISKQSCKQSNLQALEKCFYQYIQKTADEKGYQAAIKQLDDSKANPSLAKLCHFAAHSLGKDAYTRFKSVSKAIKAGGLSCSNGYYHGIMESAGANSSSLDFVKEINNYCLPLLQESVNHMDCAHGIGHASYINSNFDLTQANVICGNLNTSLDRLMCSSGVFMQWGIDYRNELIQPRNPENIRDLCLASSPNLPKEYKTACLENILLALNIEDFKKLYSFENFRVWCDTLKDNKSMVDCYYGIGYAANGLVDFDYNILAKDVCGVSTSLPSQKCIHRMSQGYGAVLGSAKMISDICDNLSTAQRSYCINVKKYELR